MDGFYKDALTLAAAEFSDEEMELLRPPLTRVNGGLKAFTRLLLRLQAQARCGGRLKAPSADSPPPQGSLMLCAVEGGSVVGVVEVSIEPRDGRVPGDVRPLHPPWAPRERVAYVSNLAVVSALRGKGLGRRLLRAAEGLAARWGHGEVYLHASADQPKLLRFYADQDYAPLPEFDAPQWVLALSGREQTRYHCRPLDSRDVESLAAAADAMRRTGQRRA
mmetsp:Transcript_21146/g.66200  ORF Transcript_21146/g.66200 Transcript_21146/m.66200 type:complete len:220 (-) Transcript_21146:242-901(-)